MTLVMVVLEMVMFTLLLLALRSLVPIFTT